jgi:uncharacterized protein DUF3618
MVRTNSRTPSDVRREIAAEREQLAGAVDELRAGLGEVTNVGARLRSKLPIAAAGAGALGFVLAGGVGATMRFLARRGREGREKARFGRFSFVDRS